LQLREFGHFVQFPMRPADLPIVETLMQCHFQRGWVGAVLVEPIQARGGINIPPPGFLPLLRRLCDEHKALLIIDEIYTGFGRTGKWFACEHSGVVPDIICLGKALTGGFPLSACVGRADVMDAAWPASRGEAIHTSTFLGNPVGCAMALAQINEIRENKLPERAAMLGEFLLAQLSTIHSPPATVTARGLGLMAGLELRSAKGAPETATAMRAIKAMLREGFILLPEGEHGNVISFTPPLTITKTQLTNTVDTLAKVLNETL
jgi:4-aminobutyrate aminotransferase-like enzyme